MNREKFLEDLSWATDTSYVYAENFVEEVSDHATGFVYKMLTLLVAVTIYFKKSKLAKFGKNLAYQVKLGFVWASKMTLNFYRNVMPKRVMNQKLIWIVMGIVIWVCISMSNWQPFEDFDDYEKDDWGSGELQDEPEKEHNYPVGFPAQDITIMHIILMKKLHVVIDFFVELFVEIKTNLGIYFFDLEF